ncbi:MAG: choice-of-anchor Q domain-containing protein [Chloroflexota bacterium]
MKNTHRFLSTLTLIVLLFAGLPVRSAAAATLIVTNTNDSGPGSLRQTIVSVAPGDTITFDPSLSGQTILLNSVLIIYVSILTIDASDLDAPIQLSGGDTTGILLVNAGQTITLDALEFVHGNFTGSGGAITNSGTLTIINSTFSNNTAVGNAGSIANDGTLTITDSTFSKNTASQGGAIYNYAGGSLIVSGSTFENNRANAGGSISNAGTALVSNSTFYANSVTSIGGGIHNRDGGVLTVANSTFSDNSAVTSGGAILNDTATLHLKNTILANSLSGDDCVNSLGTVATNINNLIETNAGGGYECGAPALNIDPNLGPLTDNGGPTWTMIPLVGTPVYDAGDNASCETTDQRGINRLSVSSTCDIGAVEIRFREVWSTDDSGPNSLRQVILDASPGDIIIFSSALAGQTISLFSPIAIDKPLIIDGFTMVSRLKISGGNNVSVFTINDAVGFTINHLEITNGNSGTQGGGIYNLLGELVVMDSVFSQNEAANQGGGIWNGSSARIFDSTFSNNAAYGGGAIANQGNLLISGSTFTNNSSNPQGGAIWNHSGNLSISNSTFTGNSATYSGGGVYNGGVLGNLTVLNSTFSANSATVGAGIDNTGKLNLSNTILANSLIGPDCNDNGDLLEAKNNLIENNASGNDACGTPKVIADPNLGQLANNGGQTKTLALKVGSPAINAGDDTVCAPLDQRGVKRPKESHCDIGAYEFDLPKKVSTLRSQASYDGWVLESSELSNNGGSLNRYATTFRLGDDKVRRQYRSILTFSTKGLPDNAAISKVTLKIRRQGVIGGGNPVTSFQGLMADVRRGFLGTSIVLQTGDFNARASSGYKSFGPFKPALVTGWYSINLTAAKAYINKLASAGGVTQIRLRFKLDDNNAVANYLSLYSGNASSALRPQLIIEYYVP